MTIQSIFNILSFTNHPEHRRIPPAARRLSFTCCLFLLASCSVSKQISKTAKEEVFGNKALLAAHVGISIFEPATGKYWYDYQGDKYFVPASNTKLPTCYAAMKYLGDSLPGLKYGYSELNDRGEILLAIQPTGDPTLLHPDFATQPVWDFLTRWSKRNYNEIGLLDTAWREERWGSGWSWSDYDAAYMAERSSFPVFGNLVDIKVNPFGKRNIADSNASILNSPILFKTQAVYFDSLLNRTSYYLSRENLIGKRPRVRISRAIGSNEFNLYDDANYFTERSLPFVTNGHQTALRLIGDSLHLAFGRLKPQRDEIAFTYFCPDCRILNIHIKNWNLLYSRPTDSLLKPMMRRSDNFFAEQSLLMVSNAKLGVMSDEKIIDTLLKTDFSDLPQKPRWADGSGLSRYNLFTPQDFVAILGKMKNEFGMERVKRILPTGGEGTISNYYKSDSGYIFGKTGTLSGVVAFSGYLYTKKGRLFIFSTLVNNHTGSATEVRRAIEKFLQGIRNRF